MYAINKVGVVTCADAKTGDVVWRSPRLKGPFSSSPIACDGKLYFVSEKGVTSVLQVGDPPKVLAVNNTPGNTLSSPAIADGALFIRSDEYLYCIEEKK
ncbi:MAG: hypothetical protein KatS3mg105_3720 [Gemmatales bacterium]|nr:MAG: hypothetical protein KatS3mg105_3720 [Gemmatales bacterium]